MSDAVIQESPLAFFWSVETGTAQADTAGVTLGERAFQGHISLRGDATDRGFLDAVQSAAGVGLPLEANTVAESGEVAALWLGPDEWLLLTSADRAVGLYQGLRDALAGIHAAVTDLTGGQTVITVRGPRARDVLAKGCSLDLHPRAFGPGRCAQSHLAKASVIIRQVDESPSYDVIVRRSFAEYLALWLKDASLEYGVALEGEVVRLAGMCNPTPNLFPPGPPRAPRE